MIKGFIWNPSICERECDKSCDIGQYLDYKNCKCRKELINKLVEESRENFDGNKMVYGYEKVSNSCTKYIVLLVILFIISTSISSVFIYFHWYLKKDNTIINTSVNTETVIYYVTDHYDVHTVTPL